jgi:hypothetical protein
MHNPAFPRAPQHLLRVVACWCGYVLRRELRGQCVVNCVVDQASGDLLEVVTADTNVVLC